MFLFQKPSEKKQVEQMKKGNGILTMVEKHIEVDEDEDDLLDYNDDLSIDDEELMETNIVKVTEMFK